MKTIDFQNRKDALISATRVVMMAAVIGVVMVSCGGRGGNQQSGAATSETQTEVETQVNSLFDIPKEKIIVDAKLDKNTVFAEIPAEFFKGVGELAGTGAAAIFNNTLGIWKYSIQLRFYVKSGEDSAKTLIDYYKSIGGTVREIGLKSNFAEVTFSWGESVEIAWGSFEGQDSVRVQFNAVKE